MFRFFPFSCLFLLVLSSILLSPSFVTANHSIQTLKPVNSLQEGAAPSNHIEEEYEGVHLEIDIATNKMTVFLNTRALYSFRVATGKNKTNTPLGRFRIITKVENPWYLPKNIAGGDPSNPLGTRWLGLNVPNTNGYKYGIHGTNNPYSIGGYVTQGCVRLQNNQVEWLFRHIEVGTPVIIKNSAKNS